MRGRLVHEQQVRRIQQQLHQRQAALLTAAEHLDLLEHIVPAEEKTAEQRADELLCQALRGVERLFEHRAVQVQHVHAILRVVAGLDVVAEGVRALLRRQDAPEYLQQGGLARPVRPHQHDALAALRLEIHPAIHLVFAVGIVDVHYAYGEHEVYRGMNFQAERGQRIVLVGPNGAGKSTLLKILGGVLTPQQGTHTLGHNVKAGYYSQYRVDMLHLDRTVLEEAFDTPQRLTEQFVRTLLGCFLFSGDDVFKKVEVQSGGEKSRLALVKLLLDPPNLLLM